MAININTNMNRVMLNENAGSFIADASDLGIRAGQSMPDVITLDYYGELIEFNYVNEFLDVEGDIAHWRYNSKVTAEPLIVFND